MPIFEIFTPAGSFIARLFATAALRFSPPLIAFAYSIFFCLLADSSF